MTERIVNWAGNVAFTAARLHRPSSVDELRELVAGSQRIRALGSGHSFNRLADSTGDLVTVAGLPPVIEIDRRRSRVTVAAGVRYGELAGRLHAEGYALHNLASLPHISVAGSCATGTHGSGDRNGSLATAVAALELVTADGDLRTVSRDDDPDAFNGMVVGLGGFGIVTALTLDIVPAFDIRQYVYDDLPYERLRAHWTEIFASGYSVSVLTDWTGPRMKQVWLKRRADERDSWTPEPIWLGASLADGPRHPIAGMSPANCTRQGGVAGPWHARLPHFRMEFTPSSGAEMQSEYLVARHLAMDALAAVDHIRDRLAPVVQVCELRTVAADELWLSPAYRRDSVGLHFTWISDAAAVTPVLAALEERLAPFAPRPHWGKLFGISPEVVAAGYDRYDDFRRLLRRWDPAGTFRNEFMDRYFPGDG